MAGQPLWHGAQLWGRMLHFRHGHIQVSCIILHFCRKTEKVKKRKREHVCVFMAENETTERQSSDLTAAGDTLQRTKFITSKI